MRFAEHAAHRTRQSDSEIVLGGQRFCCCEHTTGGIEKDRIGVGAAGIKAEKKRQDVATLN